MKQALEDALAGRTELSTLSVTYDDVSVFHGDGCALRLTGLELVVVEQLGREAKSTTRSVDPDKVRALVRLLLDLEAWEQRTPDRLAIPDETRARLHVACRNATSGLWDSADVWEWFGALRVNDRLQRVRDFMKTL
jgi:hypothetical protein